MTSFTRKRIAVVTGAAGGIGASFARQLAAEGYDLFLVDCRAEPLRNLVTDLHGSYDVAVETAVTDLTDRTSVTTLAARLASLADVELLINNAGFGALVEFSEMDVERHAAMVALHVETPMRLVHAVLPGMRARNRGGIINVASLGAFVPCVGAVQYASTKAYLVVFSEALAEELRSTNIRVQALCPGFVRTDFHASEAMAGFHQRSIPSSLWMTADQIARCSLASLPTGRVVVIPGWRSRTLGLLMRMVLVRPIVRVITRPRNRGLLNDSPSRRYLPSP